MRTKRTLCLMLTLCMLFSMLPSVGITVSAASGAQHVTLGAGVNANVFLGNNKMELGISPIGSFGTTQAAPSSFHPASLGRGYLGLRSYPWDASTDYFLPGTVDEGFMLAWADSISDNPSQKAYAASTGSGYVTSIGYVPASNTDISTVDELKAKSIGTAASKILLTQNTSFVQLDAGLVKMEITLKNIGAEAINKLEYIRAFDPDQNAANGLYDTNNYYYVETDGDAEDTGSPVGTVWVCASTENNNSGVMSFDSYTNHATTPFIFIAPPGDDYTITPLSQGVGWNSYNSFTDVTASSGTYQLGKATYGDVGIGLRFKLGTLEANQEKTLTYYFSLDSHIDSALEMILKTLKGALNYIDEQIKGFEPSTNYNVTIKGENTADDVVVTVTSDANGNIKLEGKDTSGSDYSLIGKNITISTIPSGSEPLESQDLTIDERPSTEAQYPAVPSDLSPELDEDLNITTTHDTISIKVKDQHEYSIDGGKTWRKAAPDSNTVVFDGLTETEYTVLSRVSATENSFASSVIASANVKMLLMLPDSDITISGNHVIYTGEAQKLTAMVDGAVVTYATTLNGTYSATAPAYTNIGSRDIYYRIEKAGYHIHYGMAEMTISKAPVLLTIGNEDRFYDGNPQSVSFDAKISSGLDVSSFVELLYDKGTGPVATEPIAHGTYTVTARLTPAGEANLEMGTYTPGTLKIRLGPEEVQDNLDVVENNLRYAIEELEEALETETTNLARAIADLTTAYAAADAALKSAIDTDITALENTLVSADAVLTTAIQTVQSNLDTAVEDLEAEDIAINTAITNLDNAYKAADALLNSEIAALKAEDIEINNALTALDTAYKAADAALEVKINTVQTNLNNAVAELETALAELRSDLSAEIDELETAFNEANTLLKSEIAALKAEDVEINTALTALDTAYKAADAAIWEALNDLADRRMVSFISDGMLYRISVVENGNVVLVPQEPTRSGYAFEGWFVDESCTEAFDFSKPVTANIEIYAKWTRNVFIVEFLGEDGGTYRTMEAPIGTTLTAPTAPDIAGRDFIGWFNGAVKWDFATDVVTEDMELTAKYSDLETYTITYYDGDKAYTGSEYETQKSHGILAMVTETIPTKTGYLFNGWNTKKDGRGTSYGSGDYYPIDANLNLYAQWGIAGVIPQFVPFVFDGTSHDITLNIISDLEVLSYQWYFKADGKETEFVPVVGTKTVDTETGITVLAVPVKNVSESGEYYCSFSAKDSRFTVGNIIHTTTDSIDVVISPAQIITLTGRAESVYKNSTLDINKLYELSGALGSEVLKLDQVTFTAQGTDGNPVLPAEVTNIVGTHTITVTSATLKGTGSENYILNLPSEGVQSTVIVSERNSGGSGGGGGGAAPTTTNNGDVKITTTSGHTSNTNDVKVTTSENKTSVELSENIMSSFVKNAIDEGKQDNKASVKVTVGAPTGSSTVAVGIPVPSIETLAKSTENATMTVETPVGNVTLDQSALKTTAANATGETVILEVTKVEKNSLLEDQQRLVGDRPVIDLSITSNGKQISELNGTATISIPYTPATNEDTSNLVVWYLADSGDLMPMACEYADGMVTFETTHFSKYVVANFPFKDVVGENWFYRSVAKMSSLGIMNGTSDTAFSPNASATRGMVVSMLYRLAEQPEVSLTDIFSDVQSGAYYEKAVIWANQNGFVNGVGESKYAPDTSITREQLVSILYRYAGSPVITMEDVLSNYFDSDEIDNYAKLAFAWAVKVGIIQGNANNTLNPDGNATRAEIATMFSNYITKTK